MSEAPDIYWYLPTHGDGPYLGTDERHRPATLGYLSEIARAADRFGFKGVLLPTGTRCEDAWIIAAALIPQTRDLRFLVALRPGSGTPALFARHAATLDRISGGRVLVNVVTGADPADLAGDGYMTEGFALALDFAFRRLALHRVEANVQPANRRSIALVSRLGFEREGYSRRYVKISGRWRDHVRFAMLAEDWKIRRAAVKRAITAAIA